MNNQKFLLTVLAVLLAITLGLGIALIAIGDGSSNDSENTPHTDFTEPQETEPVEDIPEIPTPTFSSDLAKYERYMNANDEKYLILINKSTTIDESFSPEKLVAVKDASKSIELSETAEMALEAMFIEMRKAGFNNVFVTSAYRSYLYQSSLFNTYINQEMAKGLSYEKAKENVLTYSAYPGTSEHHTGLAVDLMTTSMSDLDESFADEPVYPWLLENAWKFGFILRYPEDKVDVTGYSFEPWHYRFVGRHHAYLIYKQGLCLEEYLAD